MKTVGQVLAEARASKGITYVEAERSTKIRASILEAIEADDFSSLQGPTYIRGFIKNYGDYLGLDSEHLLAIFRRQYDSRQPLTGSILPDLSPKETPKLVLTPGRALGMGVSILVLGFVGYLLAQYQSFAAAPVLQVNSPNDNLRVNNGTVEVVGRTDRDATLKINGQQVQLTESGAFSVSVTLPDGVNDLTFSSVNKLGRVTTLTRTVTVETAQAKEPLGPLAVGGPVASPSADPVVAAAATSPAQVTRVEVTLKIGPAAAWVRVQSDATSFEGILAAGVTKTFKAQDEITVKTGNAGSTEVIVDGVSQGKMGSDAEVITKTFSR